MIVWNRWGFLVPAITFGALLLAEYASEAWSEDPNYYQQHGWPMSVALTASALIIWVIARRRQRWEQRILLDPQTGRNEYVTERSSFMFVPMTYWPPLLLLLALVGLIIV